MVRRVSKTPALAEIQATSPSVEAQAPAPKAEALGLELSVKLDAFVTQGRTFAVDVASDNNDGIHGINWGLELGLGYLLPLPEPWRIVALEASVAYTPFIGQGLASYQQWAARDGEIAATETNYVYDWSVHMIPLNAGLRLRLPWETLGVEMPVAMEGTAGFASGFAFASSTLTREGAEEAFAEDAKASGFGLGYYVGLGASYPLPPNLGRLVASYRYSSVKLDFDRPDFNATWGDLGGHHLVLGYRFEF